MGWLVNQSENPCPMCGQPVIYRVDLHTDDEFVSDIQCTNADCEFNLFRYSCPKEFWPKMLELWAEGRKR